MLDRRRHGLARSVNDHGVAQGSRPTARVSCGPRSGSRTTGRVNGMTAVDEVSGEGRTGACRVLVGEALRSRRPLRFWPIGARRVGVSASWAW